MIEFALGVAVGAVFAPFWMGLWNVVSNHPAVKSMIAAIAEYMNKPKQ